MKGDLINVSAPARMYPSSGPHYVPQHHQMQQQQQQQQHPVSSGVLHAPQLVFYQSGAAAPATTAASAAAAAAAAAAEREWQAQEQRRRLEDQQRRQREATRRQFQNATKHPAPSVDALISSIVFPVGTKQQQQQQPQLHAVTASSIATNSGGKNATVEEDEFDSFVSSPMKSQQQQQQQMSGSASKKQTEQQSKKISIDDFISANLMATSSASTAVTKQQPSQQRAHGQLVQHAKQPLPQLQQHHPALQHAQHIPQPSAPQIHVPAQVQHMPSQAQHMPPQAQHMPPQAPHMPPQAQHMPPQAPNMLTQAQHMPPQAPNMPPQAPHMPPQAQHMPPQAPYLPPQTPHMPPQAQHMPPQAQHVPPEVQVPQWLTCGPLPQLYLHALQACHDSSTGQLDTNRIYDIFLRSGLPRPILGQVWDRVNRTVRGCLTEPELCQALALIALCQRQAATLGSAESIACPPLEALVQLTEAPVPDFGVSKSSSSHVPPTVSILSSAPSSTSSALTPPASAICATPQQHSPSSAASQLVSTVPRRESSSVADDDGFGDFVSIEPSAASLASASSSKQQSPSVGGSGVGASSNWADFSASSSGFGGLGGSGGGGVAVPYTFAASTGDNSGGSKLKVDSLKSTIANLYKQQPSQPQPRDLDLPVSVEKHELADNMLEDSFNDFVDTSGSSSGCSRSDQHTTGCSSPVSSDQQSSYDPQPAHVYHYQRHQHLRPATVHNEQSDSYSTSHQQEASDDADTEFADFAAAPAAHLASPPVNNDVKQQQQPVVSLLVDEDEEARQPASGLQQQFNAVRLQPISIEEAMAQALSFLPSRLKSQTGGSVGGDTGSVRSLELTKPADAASDTASTGAPSTAAGASAVEINSAPISADAKDENNGGRDRYEVLKQLERPDEAGPQMLIKCLDATLARIQEASSLFAESEDCQEVLDSGPGSDYVQCLSEVRRLAGRLLAAADLHRLLPEDQLASRKQSLRLAWANFVGFFTTPSGLLPSESELADSVRLRANCEDADVNDGGVGCLCRCCICLNYVDTSDAILYAGRRYHCPCANFWINEIDSVLPDLTSDCL